MTVECQLPFPPTIPSPPRADFQFNCSGSARSSDCSVTRLSVSLQGVRDNLDNMHEEFIKLQKAYDDEKCRRERADSESALREAHLRIGNRYTVPQTSLLTKGRLSFITKTLISPRFRPIHSALKPALFITHYAISRMET